MLFFKSKENTIAKALLRASGFKPKTTILLMQHTEAPALISTAAAVIQQICDSLTHDFNHFFTFLKAEQNIQELDPELIKVQTLIGLDSAL